MAKAALSKKTQAELDAKKAAQAEAEKQAEQTEQVGQVIEGVQIGDETLFLSPDELVTDRDWNGRWQAVSDERVVSADDDADAKDDDKTDKNKIYIPGDSQPMVSIRELAESIKSLGQLEDVLICAKPDDGTGRIYHVVSGLSRTRAIKMLADEKADGKDWKVRCRVFVGDINEQQAFFVNEEENRQRNNLTRLDKAYCMKREFDLNMKPSEIAKRWNCPQSAVDQALTLINLPEEVKLAVFNKLLSATEAIVRFKRLAPKYQLEIVDILKKAKEDGISRKLVNIPELVRQRLNQQATETPEEQAVDGTTATTPADGTTTNGETATATAPMAPPKAKRGRKPAAVKKEPRSLTTLRKFLNDRNGYVSLSIKRYLDGEVDMDDEALGAVLDSVDYEDGERPEIEPRTEGNVPAGA